MFKAKTHKKCTHNLSTASVTMHILHFNALKIEQSVPQSIISYSLYGYTDGGGTSIDLLQKEHNIWTHDQILLIWMYDQIVSIWIYEPMLMHDLIVPVCG